jgi:phosphoribosylamine---glycine ligase
MKVLIVGGGGREHTLAWKIASDSCNPTVFCAPGNAGTSTCATNLDIGAEDLAGIVTWARENRPDLTVVGPEVPLCAGLTDLLEAEGLRVFGPSKAAAQMEGSKIFAKDVMNAGGVPNAKSASFTDVAEAKAYVRAEGAPIVVKAEGLAAGKGVTVCSSVEQAEAAIDDALVGKAFGAAGECVLIEECLIGEEASILALIDGEHVVMLASSQDHKRALDNDEGPNTGGMGAYSPAPVVTDDMWPFIREDVFGRTLAELKRRGITFKGVLYAGLMMTESGPKVLEFNVRFGDPETQVILPRIAGDLLPAFEACVDGTLSDSLIQWRDEHCVTVVMASGGYPGGYEKGKVITGLDVADGMEDVTVFHAGTALDGESVVTAGGRVLAVTALGSDLRSAVDLAYKAVPKVHFEAAHYRSDIAAKAL